MHRLFGALTGVLFGLITSIPAEAGDLFRPETLFSGAALEGARAEKVQVSPNGRIATFLRANPQAATVRELWKVDLRTGATQRLLDPAILGGAEGASAAELARRERLRIQHKGVTEYRWGEDGRSLVVPLAGDLWLVDPVTSATRRFTDTPGGELDPTISPRGSFVAYVRDHNLYVKDIDGAREQALTTDGRPTLYWGLAEFVAQEEMRRTTGYWWSPDEARLAVARVDESPLMRVPHLTLAPSGAGSVEQRYPRAGTPNALVELYVLDRATGRRVRVDLGPEPDIYLARVAWSADGRHLYVQRQSRDQKQLDLLVADPATGRTRSILSERSEHWVELSDDFRPLKDGRFIWSSERSGFRHLYLYDAAGRLVRRLTDGAWPVDRVEGIDEAARRVLFSASKETPLERHLYAVPYDRPGEPRKLTRGAGWWTISVGGEGRVFAGTYSDPTTPPRTALYAADGRFLRWIERNRLDASHPLHRFADRLVAPTFGVLKAADGQPLHYSVMLPPGFDPRHRYPVILSVYGGPVVQKVRRRWGDLTDQLLLEAGYIVFRLDNRGSANRSVAFKTAIHGQLGRAETEDQLAGVRYLKNLPYVDPGRIGVMGWSYGGFMALMLMTAEHSPFKAGIAGAAPTDWRLYDTHYTERLMGRPLANPAGYDASDIVPRLARLNGDLLIVHGMLDDNVTVDNALRVAAALQDGGKRFEMMLYPGEYHLLKGDAKQHHLWHTYLDFLRRAL